MSSSSLSSLFLLFFGAARSEVTTLKARSKKKTRPMFGAQRLKTGGQKFVRVQDDKT